jgi:hypothetical protein
VHRDVPLGGPLVAWRLHVLLHSARKKIGLEQRVVNEMCVCVCGSLTAAMDKDGSLGGPFLTWCVGSNIGTSQIVQVIRTAHSMCYFHN